MSEKPATEQIYIADAILPYGVVAFYSKDFNTASSERIRWCTITFGEQWTIKDQDGKWYADLMSARGGNEYSGYGGFLMNFYFREESDSTLFALRWA